MPAKVKPDKLALHTKATWKSKSTALASLEPNNKVNVSAASMI